MVAIDGWALAVGEEAREIGAADWALFDAGFDAGAWGRKGEIAIGAVVCGAGAVGEERGQRGGAFEAVLEWGI